MESKNLLRNVIVAFVFFSFVFTGAAFAVDETKNDKSGQKDVVAVVNGNKILNKEFSREITRIKQQFAASGRKIEDGKFKEILNDVLENLIERELLYQECLKNKITVSSEEIDKQLETMKKRFPDEEKFKMALAQMGMTPEILKFEMNRGMIVQKYINSSVADKVKVSDADADSFYKMNPQMFKQPAKVKASHILIKVDQNAGEYDKKAAKDKILAIKEKLKKGADFAKIAKESSECPSSARGGDLGLFGKGQMVPPFQNAAFSQKIGEVGEVVETRFGFHLIKVMEQKTESVVSFDTAKTQIIQKLKQDKVHGKVKELLAKLKTSAKIEKVKGALDSYIQ
jgi:peptidyl-prolyl cis-trans isomerase C